MTEKDQISKKPISADWLLRGALSKIGDTVDRLTGRRWVPSSSLATSELIERMKKLLDAEAKEVPGKGLVVPHQIKLKMQWDKFSTDSEDGLKRLKHELLVAAADHINDALYYTYAPLSVEVKPDYFTEGVKLFVGFGRFADDDPDVEMNVTIAGIDLTDVVETLDRGSRPTGAVYVARFENKGLPREVPLDFGKNKRASLGRSSNNSIVLDDASVSKMHAALVLNDDGRIAVADTGSTNGTFINGDRIPYGKAVEVGEADQLKFGSIDLVLERLEAPADTNGEGSRSIEIEGFTFEKRERPERNTESLADTAKIDDQDGEVEPVQADGTASDRTGES
ncbi:MAG: FHA domain-containing protein [Pyrinomonadaceae bacterium]